MMEQNQYPTTPETVISSKTAADGTRKYLFTFPQLPPVETVYIPWKDRHTLCISTQAGCRLGCRFCRTGQMHLHAQLSTEHILAQVYEVEECNKLTHLVFMGMGEPFDNPDALFPALSQLTNSRQTIHFAPRRISVSTAGILPGIQKYLREVASPLSISLHSPFHEERAQLMPIEYKWPIASIMETIRKTPISAQRRIFCEYLLFKDLNYTTRHADALAELLQGIHARINLMRPHPIPGTNFTPPDDEHILQFRDELNARGLIATIRQSRGLEIDAACGMLATA